MRNIFLSLLVALGMVPAAANGAEKIKIFNRAVATGDVKQVEKMLGDDKNLATEKDEYGFQPIHLMSVYFEKRIMDVLLENGADINARNDEGITILHIIADAQAVPVLIKAGADIEAVDIRGWTPLFDAISNDDREDVIEALIESGANVNATTPEGKSALSFAREGYNEQVIGLLINAGAKE